MKPSHAKVEVLSDIDVPIDVKQDSESEGCIEFVDNLEMPEVSLKTGIEQVKHEEQDFVPTGCASTALFGNKWNQLRKGQSKDDAILLEDSDDDRVCFVFIIFYFLLDFYLL